jgi:hypothetical protein
MCIGDLIPPLNHPYFGRYICIFADDAMIAAAKDRDDAIAKERKNDS